MIIHQFGDSLRTVLRRWRRNMLTVAAMALGTASVVAILGVSQAAAEQIVQRVQAYEAQTITVALPVEAWDTSEFALTERALTIPGLIGIGTVVVPQSGTFGLSLSHPVTAVKAESGAAVATKEGLDTRGVVFIEGGYPDPAVIAVDPHQVVLGTTLARELGVSTAAGSNRITVNGVAATVAGVVRDGGVNSSLTTTTILPPGAASFFNLLPPTRQLEVAVQPGMAESVGAQLPIATYPSAPDAVSVAIPPSPQQLRAQLTSDTRGLVLVITVVMVAATSFGIVTTMQISVWERRREIGLSRALGMTRRNIAVGFLLECTILGGVGSALGWVLGVYVSSIVQAFNGWSLSLPPEILLFPLLGVVVGAVSGLLPAKNAAKVDPAELLRS